MAVFKCSIEESGGLDYAKVLRGYKTLPLVEVGDEIRARMVQIIDVNRKREVRDTYDPFLKKDRPHLKDVLKVEVFGHGNGIGIGNIDELQEKAPYWRVLNNGGYTPPATAGWFGSGNPQGGDSAFTYVEGGSLMVPHKPIEGIHFIEKTNTWAIEHLRRFLDRKVFKIYENARQKSLMRVAPVR